MSHWSGAMSSNGYCSQDQGYMQQTNMSYSPFGQGSPFTNSVDQHHFMSNSNEDQNKLERKRARNREAASKCRQKKIDRIKELECQVNMEKSREAKLMDEQKQLTNIFSRLQEVLNEHKRVGCGL